MLFTSKSVLVFELIGENSDCNHDIPTHGQISRTNATEASIHVMSPFKGPQASTKYRRCHPSSSYDS
jgi:hypothetical protein